MSKGLEHGFAHILVSIVHLVLPYLNATIITKMEFNLKCMNQKIMSFKFTNALVRSAPQNLCHYFNDEFFAKAKKKSVRKCAGAFENSQWLCVRVLFSTRIARNKWHTKISQKFKHKHSIDHKKVL